MKALMRAAVLFAATTLASAMGHAATMQCAPYQSVQASFPSGATYTADLDGIVTGVANNDLSSMFSAGCAQIGNSGLTMIARLVGANMNVTTDQPMTSFMPPNAYYVPSYMILKDCSVSLTTAKGQVYDATSKGGNALFGSATTQVLTGCTGAGTTQSLAANTTPVDASTAPPILSLTTAQGAAATANVYVYGYVLGK